MNSRRLAFLVTVFSEDADSVSAADIFNADLYDIDVDGTKANDDADDMHAAANIVENNWNFIVYCL